MPPPLNAISSEKSFGVDGSTGTKTGVPEASNISVAVFAVWLCAMLIAAVAVSVGTTPVEGPVVRGRVE